MITTPDKTYPTPDNSVELLERFVKLWKSTWIEPNDKSHMYSEFYEYAVVILATPNKLQSAMAEWLLFELDCEWSDFDDDQDCDQDWLNLYRDISTFINAYSG